MSIGMAVAGKHFGARLDENLFNNKTWVLLGDGCMQGGCDSRSCSMAGHLKLDNSSGSTIKITYRYQVKLIRSVSDDHRKIFEVWLGCRRGQRSRSRCFARGNGPSKKHNDRNLSS